MKEKGKFHLTTTDNETGEVLNDYDAVAIIGGATLDNDVTNRFAHVACDALHLAATVKGAEHSLANVKERSPQIGPLCDLLGAAAGQSPDEDDEE